MAAMSASDSDVPKGDTMRLTVLALALSVGLVLALAGSAGAAPGQRATLARGSVSDRGTTFLERAWGFISCFWSEEGCSIDPLGAPSNKAGSIIDPLGAPSNKEGSSFDPLGVPANEAGSGFDPLGAPAPGSPVDAGCSLDPLGGCGR